MLRASRVGGTVVVVVVVAAFISSVAFAAFPGSNGRIVFVKGGGNNSPLYSVNPDGSGLRKITRGRYDSAPTVAPNGRTIAFTRGGKVFTVEMAGKHLRRLTSDDGTDPAFSGPLGRRIAFTRFNSVTSQIWLMASDGTGERRLTDPQTADRFPNFSPDGRWIAFVRDGHNRNEEVWKMRSDGSGLRRLTHVRQSVGQPSFAPDGKSIAYERLSKHGKFVIDLMRANGTHARRLRLGEDPAFSPNGKRIVFVRHEEVVYTMNRRGKDLRRVTPHSWTAWEPDWAVRTGNG
jgi:Tol biopolymer transport system component